MSFSKLKDLIFRRAKGLCEYCKSPANISTQPFVVEHIVPKSKGGETTDKNLALSCQGCNNHKYNKTSGFDSVSSQEMELFHPRAQNWNENFSWSDELTEVLGKTAAGRVTVNELKLNRQELKNLRNLLADAGKHPPDED